MSHDRRYCRCGRKIVVRKSYSHRVHVPAGSDHDLCQRCWRSMQDAQRLKG